MCTEFRRRDFLKGSLLGAASWGLSFPAGSVVSAAESAVEWPSFRNGLKNQGVAETSLPEEPKLLWEVASPDGVTSTPVIADGRVYVGTLSGDLLCLELDTGKEVWKYQTGVDVPPNELAPGFNSPLTLAPKTVLAGDDQGTMHAVDRASGEKKWSFATLGEIVGGGAIVGDRLIFGSHAEKLFALSLETGEPIWSVDTQGPVNGTPTVVDHFTFITGCSEPLMHVIDTNSGEKVGGIPLDALLLASAAERDGILYFGTDAGAVHAINWKEKQSVWEYSVPKREQRIQSSPAVTEDLVVVGSRDKHLHAIDRKTGAGRWQFKTRAAIDSSPVVVGNRVFFGGGDKNLYALSLASGEELWRYNAGQGFTGSPAVVGGKLVVGTDSANGRVLCFG
ncbi:MAG: PQQ-binding-like beta-propeller repeat protein [Planctomycetaceae bacterium]|nr:PQQ-binding-like beta-propeller repeat protein [Planctomycetaceae bacterium]